MRSGASSGRYCLQQAAAWVSWWRCLRWQWRRTCFADAAFFSIGSNDLTQYVTASSRDDGRVAALNDCGHPAVGRLIASVARFGRENGIPVSLCGDMASDVRHLKTLLDAGLTSLSVAPSRVARIKAALAEM